MTSDLNSEICARDAAMIAAFDRRQVRTDTRHYRVDTPAPIEASTIADLAKKIAALEAAVAELKRGADVPPPPKHAPGMSAIPDVQWQQPGVAQHDSARRSIEQVRAEAKAKADQRWKTGLPGGSK